MGPGVYGLVKDLVGKPRTLDDGRPGSFYVARFRNLTERHPNFMRGYGFEGGSGTGMFPDNAYGTPGFGAAYKKAVRDYAGAFIGMGGIRRSAAALRKLRRDRSRGQGPLGHSGAALPLSSSATTKRRWPRTWPTRRARCFEAAGIEVLSVNRDILTEG